MQRIPASSSGRGARLRRLCESVLPVLVLAASPALAGDPPPSRASAPQGQAAPLFVSRAWVDGALAPIGEGYAEWVRQRLAAGGVPVHDGRVVRGMLPPGGRSSETATLLGIGRRLASKRALLLDLRLRRGMIEIDLRLYDLEGASMIGGALGVASGGTLAPATGSALAKILPELGAATAAPPDVEEMAAASRAMALLDGGDPAQAWRELEGLESSYADALRAGIERTASRPDVPISERARLLASQGRAAEAWPLIAAPASRALSEPDSDFATLLAAGEVRLAQGDAEAAGSYFDRAVEVQPRSPVASLGRARSLRGRSRLDEAQQEYERAARLDPTWTEPLEGLAALPITPSRKRARLYMQAADRDAARLRPRSAGAQLDRAIQIAPHLEAVASERAGDLHLRLGEHDASLASYERAIGIEPNADRLRGVARSQQALGNVPAAEAAYLEVLQIDHGDVMAQQGLGELYAESGDDEMAVVRLERAYSLAPTDATVKRSLARALEGRGGGADLTRALELHVAANGESEPTEADLADMAKVQRTLGQSGEALVTLERALKKRHLAMYARASLAQIYTEQGDVAAADRVLAPIALVSTAADAADSGATALGRERFDLFVQSFTVPGSRGQRVAFLGVQPASGWRETALQWLSPRIPDLAALDGGLAIAVGDTHSLAPLSIENLIVTSPGQVEQLYDFDAEESRSASLISYANLSLEVSSVFVARIRMPYGGAPVADLCGGPFHYVLEMRKLTGAGIDREVSVLANRACVKAGGDSGYDVWNYKAGVAWTFLLVFLLLPVLRGWGSVLVTVKLPENARALVSVSLSRRPRKVKDGSSKKRGAATWVFQKQLENVRFFERRLKGHRTSFGMVSARSHYVTLRGPLMDLKTERLIGEFLEEKTLRVRPWRRNEIQFDLRTRTAAVSITPTLGGQEVAQARVAFRGDPQSVRFTTGGKGYLYAPVGSHVVVIGAGDRVVERALEIEKTAPVTLPIELSDPEGLVFADCEAAVALYLECDYEAAAAALEAAGQASEAHRVRAVGLRARGDRAGAARELEAAGMFSESAELRSGEAPDTASAALFEEAGQNNKAAEAFEAAGDMAAAARNYELAYDYQRALDCYQEVGDTEKVIELLETTGDFYEAGKMAAEADQVDRAISALQQVDQRHGFYSEASRMLADLLARRGEVDLAVDKYIEALSIWGDDAPLEMQQSYAELLERAGRYDEALTVFEGIRRKDLHFGDVGTRVETLRKQVSQLAEETPTVLAGQATVAAAGAGPVTPATTVRIGGEGSRYEILDELGRGGMGVVYRARDRNLGRVVALKVLPENLSQHKVAVKLFLREARAAAALNHRNIVTLFDAGQEGSSYFLTMECLEGAGLDAVLRSRGPLSTKAAASVALQVAAGLDYAQQQKIVHRDIKPSNLFLTKERVVKIMDFGLAKMVEEVRRSSTVIGGTPNFMAPEQATGGAVDHRTDLYAFGGTLFELVTGTVPYEQGDVVYHHVHTPPPDARERNLEVPEAMAELIKHLMAKDPNDRIQSARDLATGLQGLLKG